MIFTQDSLHYQAEEYFESRRQIFT